MPDREFEQFLNEFKRLWPGTAAPTLSYLTLRHLLDLWDQGRTPQQAVDLAVKNLAAKEVSDGRP